MEQFTLADPWRDATAHCTCDWEGPGFETISFVEETYANHHCPTCDALLFRVIFYVGETKGD